MTREQAKKFLTDIGIAEPTDEQVSQYLNNVNGAIKTEKDKADLLKSEAEKAKDLQAKLDAIEAEKLSDVEKANKATEQANAKIAELQKDIKKMETRTKLAEIGIVGEQADKFFTEDGSLDFDILGQVISDREKQASALKEKEILKDTPNPGGSGAEPKTDAEKFAESYSKRIAESNKVTSDIMSHYI